MNRPKAGRAPLGLVLAVLIALLSVLSAQAAQVAANEDAGTLTLTFLRDQAWDMQLTLTPGAETLEDMGDPDAIGEEMDELVGYLEDEGIEASWKETKGAGGARTFAISAKGEGYDNFLREQFTIEEVDFEGVEALRFEFSSGLWGFAREELALNGGRILETDGEQKGGSVRWTDLDAGGYAILTPKGGGVPWWVWLIIGLALAAAAGAAAWLLLGRRSGAARPAAVPAGGSVAPHAAQTISCPHCGAPGQTSGRFCSQCGQKIP